MGRKGQLCTLLIVARRMGSVAVQFEDGHKAVSSAKALGPVPHGYQPPPRLPFA
jgi:hypothetical protein